MTAGSYVLMRHVCGDEYEIAKIGANGMPNITYRAFYKHKQQVFRLYPLTVRFVGSGDIINPHSVPASKVLPR